MTERDSPPLLPFAGLVVAGVVAFALLEPLVVGLGRLPPAAYERAFFAPEIPARVVHLVRTRLPVAAIAAGVLVIVLAVVADGLLARSAVRRRLVGVAAGWDAVEEGRALRWLVGAITGVAALSLAAYPYNLYLDRAHLADRLLVVALWGALLWRPIFALPFALVAGAVAHQFQLPLGSYSTTELELLVRVPILLGAWWIVRALVRDRRPDAFVFLLCCLMAVTWWSSGWGKLSVGWITHPYVHLLLLGAHANGWLGVLRTGTVEQIADVAQAVRVPMMLLTLAVECGSLLVLARRWTLPAFLALTIAFHLGAFALTGILFWKWILVDAAFLAFLLRGRRIDRLRIFGGRRLALAVLLVVGQRAWIRAQDLTWFDTPLTYSIRLEGLDAAGGTHALPAGFFRPFAETFVLETFPYLSPHPQLTGAMGVTRSRALADALVVARDPAAVFELERLAAPRSDTALATNFDGFVARSLRTANRRGAEGHPRRPGVPRHLWTTPLDAGWPGRPAIVRVRVVEVTSFYDGRHLRVLRRRLLRTIDVATGTATAIGR